ncbi:uncharacterized protein LOC143186645 [Calliopsis andreniformis]|uniref:uncharacterized protein LOC143186645 n=1 Tax=Calliopsis andreniformis TaxID=337506 RepID=UPI003FCC3640
MSGSPKIGLFGSKDTTKEVKKEAKDDSDLETYDTEALSIMDINDIIGVQSEPVSDSTLESEIAALSQIITESKMDGIQNVTEEKSETEERGVVEEQGPSKVEDTDVVQTSDTTLDELENICNSEKVCVSNVEQLNQENSQLSSENNVQEKLESNNQQEDNDNCESNVVTYPMSTINVKDSEKVNDTNKTIPVGECTSTLEVIKNEDSVNMPNITQEKKYSESNICGSLQLIGEAYSSEDSQDTNINDIEEKPVDISGNSNENCLSLSESKKETNESYELQNIVNNIVSISDSINSDKICINKDVSVITAEAETHSIEECKKEVDKLEVIQENETVEHCNIEINKEHIESMNEKPIQDGKQEVNLTNDDTETKEHQESECVNVEKEKSHQSVDIHEEIEVNQESKEHMNTPNIENYINDNDTCSVDTHDNTNVTQKENELEIKSTQSHSKSIDDHSVNESQKSTFLPTEDSSEVLETKADMLELPQEKQEIAIEKLEATGEEMQQDSLQTVTGQLISVKEGQCLTANSEKIECTDVNAMELSIAQEKPEKELKTLNSETDTKSETPMEVELNLNSVDCISKSQAIPNDAAPMDTTTTEDNSVNKIDSLEENSEDVIESKEQIKDTINEEIFIVTDIPEECTESKKVEDSEKHIDINLNLPKESKVKNEEEDLKCEHAVETETNELKEDESSSKVDDEESAKELLKEDAVTTLQNEIDTKCQMIVNFYYLKRLQKKKLHWEKRM